MQPTYELTLHPVDLARHGLNPYGQPMYRVVWADSRKSKVSYLGKMVIMERYAHQPECKGRWVLEKWAPPEVIVGMTRSEYEAMLAAFPAAAVEEYPERGDYELSAVFDRDGGPFNAYIDETALHAQLELHTFRNRTMTLTDRKAEAEEIELAEKIAGEEKFAELFHA